MRKLLALSALCAMLMIGCSNKEKEDQLQQELTKAQGEQAALQQSIAERDKYFADAMRAINEVYADLETARVKEAQVVERAGGAEGPAQITNADTRQKLLKSIDDIGSALKENRKKITDLQSRMKKFRGEIAGLNTLVENLKKSLQEREQSIAQLETRVQGLEATVAEKAKMIEEKENVIGEQQKKMNTGFYVVGTRKELKEKGIITDEGGFLWGLLGSTSVMASGVDRSLFTPIDKTKDQMITVEGKIKEIIPRRSEDLFTTAQPVTNKSDLTIVHPEKFWQDNYLVIVLD
jgi:predicted  nucleic acid-binding Zn-ribbon protein